ncbi:MAG TPA: hypothetical protein VER98_00985 [Terriglobia bacterium]|nr:hypothetical protein [Terriglobia bacterium]
MTARQTAPRFKVGDSVRIASSIHTRFSGLTGVVIQVTRNRHSQTLDKYVIRFNNPDPDQNTFWDIEIGFDPDSN